MVHQELIENIEKKLSSMEMTFSIMEKELIEVREERKRIEFHPQTTDSAPPNSSCGCRGKCDLESIFHQLQRLRTENENLTYDLLEWKKAFDEKANECEINREKYLEVQKLAEEYRRQLETKPEQQTSATGPQPADEQIKEQIGELGHLPFMLETKHLELHDALTKLKLAEKTIVALSDDLESCIMKCELLQQNFDKERSENEKLQENVKALVNEIEEWKVKMDEIKAENECLAKKAERIKFLESNLEAKSNEVQQLREHLDQLQDECSRHVSRIKERAETQKRTFQAQINGLEKELIQLRANLSTAFKERDDTKQHMQSEILKLRQSFSDSQLEIRSLKSHVDILKTSYSYIFEALEDDDDDDNYIQEELIQKTMTT